MAQLLPSQVWQRHHVTSEELSAVTLHKALAPAAHTWRTRETLDSIKHSERAKELLSLEGNAVTDQTRLQGLAALTLAIYHGWGLVVYEEQQVDCTPLLELAGIAIAQLSSGAVMAPHVTSPTAYHRQQMTTPGYYALTRAAEVVISGMLMLQPAFPADTLTSSLEDMLRISKALNERLDGPMPGQPLISFGYCADLELQADYGITLLNIRTNLYWSILVTCKTVLTKRITSLENNSRSTMVATARKLLALQPGAPMSMFFYAESLELCEGRTQQALDAMKRTVQACDSRGDEVYGALSAWHTASMLVCGSKPYSKREVEGLMAKAAAWKLQLKRSGMWSIMCSQCKALSSAVTKHHKAAVKAMQPASTSNEDVLLAPATSDCTFQDTQAMPEPEKCAGCSKYFHTTLLCSRCKQARYCGKSCQSKHWPQHKATCRAAGSLHGTHRTSSNTSHIGQQGQQSTNTNSSSGVDPGAASASDQVPAAAALDAASVAAMSVRELKVALAARGLSASGCVERADLVALLLGPQGMTWQQ